MGADPERPALRVPGNPKTLQGGLVGFALSGALLTAMLCGGDFGGKGTVTLFALLGAPGGLLGALIGSRKGRGFEIVP